MAARALPFGKNEDAPSLAGAGAQLVLGVKVSQDDRVAPASRNGAA
jgi:hypothetical protein